MCCARSGDDGCELNMLWSEPSSFASFWNSVTKPARDSFSFCRMPYDWSSAAVSCDWENWAWMNFWPRSPSSDWFSVAAVELTAPAAPRAACSE